MNDPLIGLAPFTSFTDIDHFVDNNATNGMALRWMLLLDRYYTKQELGADWKETGTSYTLQSNQLLRNGAKAWEIILTLTSRCLGESLQFVFVYDAPLSDRRPLISIILHEDNLVQASA